MTQIITQNWGWGGWGSWYVKWPNWATNWHIALFDWSTGKVLKEWWSIINNLTSTSSTDVLSANQWRLLKWMIDNLMAQWRFLSLWNCAAWLPISFPLDIPYEYHTWDYFMVEVLDDSEENPTNYRPNGSSYSGVASSTVETEEVAVWDYYVYDWSIWLLATNHGKTVSFANLAWEPTDNVNLATALWYKQDRLTPWTDIEIVTTPWEAKTITWTDSLSLPKAIANSLTNLTQSWATEQRNLPYKYQQVTYIRNGASSKADTWFKPTVDDIELDIRFLAKTGSYYLWQSRDGASWDILWLWWAQNGSTITLYGWGGSVTSNISRIADNIYHVNGKLKNWVATLYVKNEDTWDEDTQTGTYTFTANNTNFYFFWNSVNTLNNWNRIYSAVLKYQWEIIGNYIPAVSSTDSSVIWFYNKIDGSFIWPEEWSWVFVAWDNVTAPLNTAPLDIHCNNWVLKYNNWVISVSWTAETLSLTGINLLSSSITYADDKYINASWVESNNIGMCASSLIPVAPSTTYTWSASAINDSRGRRIHEYDSDWVWIRQIKNFTPTTDYYTDFTTWANARYIRMSTSMTESNRMLELWNTPHDYEAYTNLWTATVESLFKLWTHADTHEILSWLVTRELRVMALDGTENYTSSSVGSTNRYTVGTPTPPLIEYSSKRWIILSTHFKSIHSSTAQTPWWAFAYASNNGTIYFVPEDQTIDSADKFKAWVKNQYDNGTPVIVIYVQGTTTTSSVAWQPLNLREWDNAISVTSSSIYSLPLSASYTTYDVNVINFTWDLSGYQTTANLKTDLTDNSDTYYPSQKAVKTAIDGKLNNRIEVTVTTAYNTVAKIWTTTAWNYTPTKWDFLLVNFVNGCSVNSPTLNIDDSWAINIKLGWADAGTDAFHLWSSSNVNVKVLMYYDWDYYKVWSVRNTTYYAMSVEEWQTGTSTSQRTMRADYLKQIIKYQAVDDTAYWSGWDWVTDTAPSKNAVYDKIQSLNLPIISASAPATPTEWMIWYDTTNDVLKTYDGSNWNECWSGWGGTENVKAFYLSSTSDLTNAQAAYDWYLAGKNPIIVYNDTAYNLSLVSVGYVVFLSTTIAPSYVQWTKAIGHGMIKLDVSSNSVTEITQALESFNILPTDSSFDSTYTPTQDWNPATKKYVDDSVTVVSGDSGTTYTIKVSNSAPASWTPNTTITFVTD